MVMRYVCVPLRVLHELILNVCVVILCKYSCVLNRPGMLKIHVCVNACVCAQEYLLFFFFFFLNVNVRVSASLPRECARRKRKENAPICLRIYERLRLCVLRSVFMLLT